MVVWWRVEWEHEAGSTMLGDEREKWVGREEQKTAQQEPTAPALLCREADDTT